MNKREEQLKKAEITIQTFLTFSILLVSYTVAVLNPEVRDVFPFAKETAAALPFVMIFMMLAIGYTIYQAKIYD